MCNKTNLECANKLSTISWPCSLERLFCVNHCFMISVCDAVSQFNNDA